LKKNLKVAGSITSIIALLSLMAYIVLNAFYDINNLYQSADATTFKSFRDMLTLPILVFGGIGFIISGIYVAKFKDELSTAEKALPLILPILSVLVLALFIFVL
jgi:hypothetical protein